MRKHIIKADSLIKFNEAYDVFKGKIKDLGLKIVDVKFKFNDMYWYPCYKAIVWTESEVR